MRFPAPSTYKSPASLRARATELGRELRVDDELEPDGPLSRAFQAYGRQVGNRFAVHPMEGWDGNEDGTPGADTLRRWRRFGRSGAKLIWGGEAFAVSADGRANPNQLYHNRDADAQGALSALRDEVLRGHREIGETTDDLLIGLQLTHSGRYAHPTREGRTPRVACRHPILDRRVGVRDDSAVLDDDALLRIAEHFVDAAALAQRSGFDFIDVKCCHGYLLHELLSARDRPGRFGGSLEHRTSFLRLILDGIRNRCPDLPIAVRLSVADVVPFEPDPAGVGAPADTLEHCPYRHGFGVDAKEPTRFDMDEPLHVLAMLAESGIEMINVTLGSPYHCPHLQRPASFPPSDGYLPPYDPLLAVIEHLDAVAQCKQAQPGLTLVGSGYSYLQEHLPHVAQAQVRAGRVNVVGLGRMVLSYPELPRDVLRAAPLDRKRICRTFSDCTTGPRLGLKSGCYPLDEHYRGSDDAARIRAVRQSKSAGA